MARSVRSRRPFDRPSRVLGAALAVSVLAHLVAVALPGPAAHAPEARPMLSATIVEMPPPPAPAPAPPPKPGAAKHKARPGAAAVVAVAAPERALSRVDPHAWPIREDDLASSQADALAAKAARALALPTLPSVARAPPPVLPPPLAPRPIPPRIELVYRGFLGTRGFFIGDAVYLLEHEGDRYSITTVAQARGLAALFIHGEGHLASTGTITPLGLQPDLYTAERTSDGRHEAAMFDWGRGTVFLHDHKTAPLAPPTFDPLAVLWQFYFLPPGDDVTEFNVATTRRVYHSRFRRVGTESIALPFAEVETEVWERDGGDGKLAARVWLAPSLHHVMVKMRLSNGRVTGEALLDSIRVDDIVARR